MRRIFGTMAAMAVAAALAGCTQADGSTAVGMVGSPAWQATASPSAKMAAYRANCEGYGYMPGTPEMAQCMQQEAQGYRDTATAGLAIASANAAAMSQPVAPVNQPVRLQTSCTTFGNMTNCY